MKEVSVGVKVSCRLQVAPTTTKEHICAGTMDGTDEVAEESCRSALPQLVMFKLREEGVPTRMGAKSREAGAKQTEGAEVARSSLAPASLDFAPILVGTPSSLNLNITNCGN